MIKRPTQRFNGSALTAEVKYPIYFTQSGKRNVLSLHYNGCNSFSFVIATKINQFKAKNYAVFFGNISEDFIINDMKNLFFSDDFNPIDTNDILDIHRYLMKRTKYKKMFGLIKKMFIAI